MQYAPYALYVVTIQIITTIHTPVNVLTRQLLGKMTSQKLTRITHTPETGPHTENNEKDSQQVVQKRGYALVFVCFAHFISRLGEDSRL